jgi:hypothetical protein
MAAPLLRELLTRLNVNVLSLRRRLFQALRTDAFSSPEPSDEIHVFEHEARARRSPNFVAKETFTFCEVSIVERLRKIA